MIVSASIGFSNPLINPKFQYVTFRRTAEPAPGPQNPPHLPKSSPNGEDFNCHGY
jgi:hypothetical protein